MGQGNLAAIEGRLGQRLARLHLDQADLQAAAGQRTRKAQARWARTDHHHVHPAHPRLLPLIPVAPSIAPGA